MGVAASQQLDPEVAARHLACKDTQERIIGNSDRLITYEKAMGHLTSRQAKALKAAFNQRRVDLTFTDMITRQTVFKKDQMLYDIQLCMIRSKVRAAVEWWDTSRTPEMALGESRVRFFHTTFGSEARKQIRYVVTNDYDGTAMHVPHASLNSSEQCGLGGIHTAFDARQCADLEDESRNKEWKYILNRNKTRTQAIEAHKKETTFRQQLSLARTSRDMAKTQQYEGLFKDTRKQRIKLETSSSHWATNADTWGTRKLQTERKWISMCDVQAPPDYRQGVYSKKMATCNIDSFWDECDNKDMANAAIMTCVLQGMERNVLNFQKVLRNATRELRYIVLDKATHEKCGTGGFLRRMTERGGTKVDRSLSQPLAPGETIDYFVSHSWEDNWLDGDDGQATMHGMEKAMVLLAVTSRFEKRHGRKPRLWVSKFCDSGSTSHEMKHMPIIMMVCDRVLMLYSDTFTTRLWCLYETYIAYSMARNGSQSASDRVDIINLGCTAADNMCVPKIHQRTFKQASCTNKMDTLKLFRLFKMSPGGNLVYLDWFNQFMQDLADANMPRRGARHAF